MENNGRPSKESQSEFLTQIVPQSQPIIRPSPLTTIEKNKEEASFYIFSVSSHYAAEKQEKNQTNNEIRIKVLENRLKILEKKNSTQNSVHSSALVI